MTVNKEFNKINKECKKNSIQLKYNYHRFSIAPMHKWTDRHCRYFHRQLTKKSLLYTEMVTTGAIIYGKHDYLKFNSKEQPISLQLGGNNPTILAQCAELAERCGFNEINLNIGCPSNKVNSGKFGACLMAQAKLVSDIVQAMRERISIPVTIKTRIGIDGLDSYAFLSNFINVVSEKNTCNLFIIHARKALLNSISPKKNREIPPLNYERVYRIKRDFPHITLVINGGIKSIAEANKHLKYVDGVMIGRAAYQNPRILLDVDRQIFSSQQPILDVISVVRSMYCYIEHELKNGTYLYNITRHMLGLFQGIPGARQWRRYLSEHSNSPSSGVEIVEKALSLVVDNIPSVV